MLKILRDSTRVSSGVGAASLARSPITTTYLTEGFLNKSSARYTSSSSSSSATSLFSSLRLSASSSSWLLALGGVGILAGASAAVVSLSASSFSSSLVHSDSAVVDQSNSSKISVTLFQYDVCPFCNKVKVFLDYNKLPYTAVEVNPLTKTELKFSEYKKVPVALINGEQVNGSNEIVAKVTELLASGAPAIVESEDTLKWAKWLDEFYVHLLSPNIYRSPSEALEAFDYITKTGNFSVISQIGTKYFGATVMYGVGKKLRKKYNMSDDVRGDLYKATDEWIENGVASKPFHGGDVPDRADLMVFGVLRAIEGLSTFNDVQKATKVGAWYSRMSATVGPSARVNKA